MFIDYTSTPHNEPLSFTRSNRTMAALNLGCTLGLLVALVAVCSSQEAWPCKGELGERASIFYTADTCKY